MPKNAKNTHSTAAEPKFESVLLEIDGRELRLAYDYNAIAEAEALLNRSRSAPVNLLVGLVGMVNANNLPGLFWAALRKQQPEITLDEASSLIRADTAALIANAVHEVHQLSLPEAKRGKA
ncbi:MAG: hypothetical protein ABI811_22950 [Acidobacteriota bacterium]